MVLLSLLCSCTPMCQVTPKEFIHAYESTHSLGAYWVYKGTRDKYHVMEYYSLENKEGREILSCPILQKTIIVPIAELPPDFPEGYKYILKSNPI